MHFKRTILLFLLFSLMTTSFAVESDNQNNTKDNKTQNNEINTEEGINPYTQPDLRHYCIIGTEIFFYDLFFNWFDLIYLDEAYADISFESMWNNITGPWIWENDEFHINQIYHPLQGAFYFNMGRSNGLSFYGSVLTNFTASLIWEYLWEVQEPSVNDMIFTNITGSYVGEILHRTYKAIEEDNPVLAFFTNPQAGINRFLTGQKSPDVDGKISYYTCYSGFNFIFSGLTNDVINTNQSDFNKKAGGDLGVYYVYNNPYGHNTKEPLDQFEFEVRSIWSNDDVFFNIFSDGLLYSKSVNFSNPTTLGLGFNYDVIFSPDIKYNNNALGLTFRQIDIFQNEDELKWGFGVNLAFFNCIEYNAYYKNPDESISNIRVYSLDIGLNCKQWLEFKSDFWGRFYLNSAFSLYKTLPLVKSQNEETGFTILAYCNTGYEHKIWNDFSLGVSGYFCIDKSFNEYNNQFHYFMIPRIYVSYSM